MHVDEVAQLIRELPARAGRQIGERRTLSRGEPRDTEPGRQIEGTCDPAELVTDEIGVGESVLVVLLDEPEAVAEFYDADTDLDSATRLRPKDSSYLGAGGTTDPAVDSRTARDLRTLINISGLISASTSIESLQSQLVQLVLSAVPGDRCALVDMSSESPPRRPRAQPAHAGADGAAGPCRRA